MPSSDQFSRRDFLQSSAVASAGIWGLTAGGQIVSANVPNDVIDIGSRRELFVDHYLIEDLGGKTQLQLHHPVPREVVLKHDAPWEGTGSGYHSVFQDGDRYRMYYKAWHLEVTEKKLNTSRHPLYLCYAESKDGINWEKPNLGLHEFEGSKQNNIMVTSGPVGSLNLDAGHPAIFKDENPNAPAEGKYKAIFRSQKPNGLLPFQSPDGVHWTPMTDKPILNGIGAFDSQNLAFWDSTIGKYRAYWRIFTAGVTNDKEWKPGGIRAIRTAVSDDLVNWGPFTDLTYVDSPPQQLYTNQIKPYHRAPHLLVGFPTRYIERGWSESMKSLPALEQRKMRAAASERYGTAITDALFMSSRDGTKFHRWNEAFLRPGPERPETWHYGHQYIAWHLVETKSSLAGAADELSLYATESYWHGKGSEVRRYTLRLDGFVSVNGSTDDGNELVTKPMKFAGARLTFNFATSAAGSLKVELQKPDGSPYDGFALSESDLIFGDTIDRTVTWGGRSDVSRLQGKPVRMRVVLNDADLYSFQFTS
jgi:hypothetical protein